MALTKAQNDEGFATEIAALRAENRRLKDWAARVRDLLVVGTSKAGDTTEGFYCLVCHNAQRVEAETIPIVFGLEKHSPDCIMRDNPGYPLLDRIEKLERVCLEARNLLNALGYMTADGVRSAGLVRLLEDTLREVEKENGKML